MHTFTAVTPIQDSPTPTSTGPTSYPPLLAAPSSVRSKSHRIRIGIGSVVRYPLPLSLPYSAFSLLFASLFPFYPSLFHPFSESTRLDFLTATSASRVLQPAGLFTIYVLSRKREERGDDEGGSVRELINGKICIGSYLHDASRVDSWRRIRTRTAPMGQRIARM